jgi:uncharacterized repeat protein (TIGR03806 family)
LPSFATHPPPSAGNPRIGRRRIRAPVALAALVAVGTACTFSSEGLAPSRQALGDRAGRSRPAIETDACTDCGLATRPANPTCRAVPPPPELAEAVLAYPRLTPATEPVMVLHHPDRSQLLLLERRGVIHRFEARPDAELLTPVLDLEEDVDLRGDAGLVAAAFSPTFSRDGRLFVSYTAYGGTVTRSRVERYTSRDRGSSFDPASRKVVLDLDQADPWRIHLNADMAFGPDGFLYVGFGDGGPQGDPEGNAQNLGDLRGKILRLDVSGGDPYRIPADNPFVKSGGRPEVFALGLRNPWRFSFDPQTGQLWVGDVGFVNWEEINLVSAGDNLGWPLREGNICVAADGCDAETTLVPPFALYDHELDASVVGGHVYRGRAIPQLADRYVFGDYMRGDVWALTGSGEPELIARTGLRIVSFAQEPSGELLMVDFGSGRLFRLVPQAPYIETLAQKLSDTGCFRKEAPSEPAAGLVPFEVRVPFWSDGAVKRRFLALPDGQSAQIRPDGSIFFPVGSVLAKQFLLGDRLIETRLMMKYRESQWTGASYVWDPDGKDARLVGDGDLVTLTFPEVDWSYPNRPTCLGCHNSDRSLGMEVAQLDLDRSFPETLRTANQLETFRRIGILTGEVPDGPRLPRGELTTIGERARAYLHVNCAVCHVRNGPTPVDMDLRYGTPLPEMRVCNVLPKEGDLGVVGARRLVPGAPDRSLLSRRMQQQGPERMPPIGTHLIDQDGADLIDGWIRSLWACP